MSKPSTRTIIALAAAAVVVVIAATAAIVAVAVHSAHRPDPQITAYAHGKSVTVPPYRFCTVGRQNDGQLAMRCNQSGTTVGLNTPAGEPLQLSLPKHIADAPWSMVLTYAFPNGDTVEVPRLWRQYPSGAMAVTVPSRPQRDMHLAGVEVQLLAPVRDENGNEGLAPYQVWSIKTA